MTAIHTIYVHIGCIPEAICEKDPAWLLERADVEIARSIGLPIGLIRFDGHFLLGDVNMDLFTVSFFGHRYVDNILAVEDKLEDIILSLMREKEYADSVVGRNGDFDQCVSSTVMRCKKKYRDDNSSLVLVLPYATAEYANNQEYFEEYYDDIEVSYAA